MAKDWMLKKGSSGLDKIKKKEPFDYTKFNSKIPKGCGWRMNVYTLAGDRITCYRCGGKGIDKWGAHCTMCYNNSELLEDNFSLNRYLLEE